MNVKASELHSKQGGSFRFLLFLIKVNVYNFRERNSTFFKVYYLFSILLKECFPSANSAPKRRPDFRRIISQWELYIAKISSF